MNFMKSNPVRPIAIHPRTCTATTLVGALVSFSAVADPKSDLFQPDAFRTGKALQKRTAELNDPIGHNCQLPAGSLSLREPWISHCVGIPRPVHPGRPHGSGRHVGEAETRMLPTLLATGSETRTYGTYVDVAVIP